MTQAVSYKTYTMFAKKYHIKRVVKGKKRSMPQLSTLIYKYEKRKKIKKGLYT